MRLKFRSTVRSYERHSVSNKRQLENLFNGLFFLRTNNTTKLRITGHLYKGPHRWSMDSPQEGSVKGNAF